jgi:hypothetical protein
MQPEQSRKLVLPSRPEDVVLASNAVEFLKQILDESDSFAVYKVVVALAEGKGLVALGPKAVFHVNILEQALVHHGDLFRFSVVTNFDPNTSSQAPGAIVQGAIFLVDCNPDSLCSAVTISGASLSFGPITQKICEESGMAFIERLIAQRVKELS